MAFDPLRAALARAFSDAAGVPDMVARADHLLGRRWRWIRLLAKRYAAITQGRARMRYRDGYGFLAEDGAVRRAEYRYPGDVFLANALSGPPRMQPVPAAEPWDLPVIETLGDLADWLWLTPEQVDWFADLKRLGNKSGEEKLQHYRYRLERKAHGGLRLIEMPKPRIRKLQRQILDYLLNRIPPHPSAHGLSEDAAFSPSPRRTSERRSFCASIWKTSSRASTAHACRRCSAPAATRKRWPTVSAASAPT